MAQNYTRQSTFADGDTITAALFNDEYNQLFNTFKYSSTDSAATGHRHDGTAGEGGNIYRIGDLDFLNKIEADSANNRWGVFVEVGGSAVEQVRIQDGAVVPVTNNDVDLGSVSLQFKDLYIDGTANIDSLVADTADINGGTIDGVTIGGSSAGAGSFTTLTASGDVNFDSGTFFVDASADAVGIGTNNPSNLLTVNSTAGAGIKVYGADQAHSRIAIDNLNGQEWNIVAGTVGVSNSGFGIYDADAGAIRLQIDASGNVGIGTSSPVANANRSTLALQGAWGGQLDIMVGSTVNAQFGTDNFISGQSCRIQSQDGIVFRTGGSSEAMRLDSSGNLGLGVTPSAWASGKAVELAGTGLRASLFMSDSGVLALSQNYYFNGAADIYAANGFATRYYQQSGQHIWNTAPSGTVGNAISFTQAMTLDASGNLGVGTASPASKLSIASGDILLDNTRSIIFKDNGGVARGILQYFSDNSTYLDAPNGNTIFRNGASNTEKMRISSAGNVGIGTISPACGLDVSNGGNGAVGEQMRITSSTANAKLAFVNTGGNGAITQNNGAMIFQTNTANTERMRIDASGNVGIGSTGPVSRLEVVNSGVASLYVGYNNTSENYYDANIHYFRNGAGTAEHVRIDASGNLLAGTTGLSSGMPNSTGMYVEANQGNIKLRAGGGNTVMQFAHSGGTTVVGSITVTASATAYNISSDARLKENIADAKDAGAKVDAIQVRQFDWKVDGSHQDYGMIAQELMTVAPEAVSGDPESDEMMGVDYSKLVPMMLKEIQSLRARVAALEA